MTPAERVAEQTRIRATLLKNGYSPLANRDKMCVLTGWPGLVVDEARIEEWSGQLRYVATGVRVEGRLVVVDLDIDDDAVLDALWESLGDDLRAVLDSAPTRFGGGVKMAMFLRLASGETAFGRMVSQAYSPVGSDGTQRVEVFASGAPRQFGVYGPRSHDASGAVATEYRWADDRGLVEVPLKDLPEVTVADITLICDSASRAMAGAGWTYEVKTAQGMITDQIVRDITDDMTFDTASHGEGLSAADLEEACDAGGDDGYGGVRLSAGWLEGAAAVNRSRCIARINAVDGRLQIWESAGCVLHRPADMDLRAKMAALSARLHAVAGGGDGATEGSAGVGEGNQKDRLTALLAAVPEEKWLFAGSAAGGGDGAEEDEAAALDARRAEILRVLHETYAYWAAGPGFVVDIRRGPEDAMSIGSFRNLLLPLSWKEKKSQRKNAALEVVNPADLWLQSAARLDVDGYRFLPMHRERTVEKDGRHFVNIWERPAFWDMTEPEDEEESAAALDTFQMFLTHLIPDTRERDWFTMWLAAKVQKPWLPNCGVVMVAERQGTGRGTLFDIVRGIFGARHVKSVAAVQLIGGGSQSQYTDWLESALFVTCDEVLAGDDSGGAMTWKRREVYERLKALIDPRARSTAIVRKGLPNNEAEVHASYLLATNNRNALPLAHDDRRIAVITNADQMLVTRPDIMQALEIWRADVGFSAGLCASLFRWLRSRPVQWDQVREAPAWMTGRALMLGANEGEVEGVLENVLNGLAGDFILAHHLRERMARALEASGMLGEVKGWWSRTNDLLGHINRMGWRKMDHRQRYLPRAVTHNVAVLFYRDLEGATERWEATPLEDRESLWTHGDPAAEARNAVGRKMLERGLSIMAAPRKQ